MKGTAPARGLSTFSPRPGTSAELFRKKRGAFYRGSFGQALDIIIESDATGENGLLKGFTSNYIPVYLSDPGAGRRGMMVRVELTGMIEKGVLGRLIDYGEADQGR